VTVTPVGVTSLLNNLGGPGRPDALIVGTNKTSSSSGLMTSTSSCTEPPSPPAKKWRTSGHLASDKVSSCLIPLDFFILFALTLYNNYTTGAIIIMTFLFEEEIIKTKKAMIFISNKDESNNLYLEVVSQDLATVWGRKRKRSLLQTHTHTNFFPKSNVLSRVCVCVCLEFWIRCCCCCCSKEYQQCN
jgi:hypothetical protein